MSILAKINQAETDAFIEQCRHRGETLQELEAMVKRAELFLKMDRAIDQDIAKVIEMNKFGAERADSPSTPTQLRTAMTSAPIQSLGYVSEDGGYIPDWRDEESGHSTDSATTLERYKNQL
jgi:hypothetical protein